MTIKEIERAKVLDCPLFISVSFLQEPSLIVTWCGFALLLYDLERPPKCWKKGKSTVRNRVILEIVGLALDLKVTRGVGKAESNDERFERK